MHGVNEQYQNSLPKGYVIVGHAMGNPGQVTGYIFIIQTNKTEDFAESNRKKVLSIPIQSTNRQRSFQPPLFTFMGPRKLLQVLVGGRGD